RQRVRVVTRDAAELPPALLVAAAGHHLLDLADRPPAAGLRGRRHEHRPEQVQRQPRPVVERLPAAPEDAHLPLQGALLADGLAQGRLQVPRVDDARIHTKDRLAALAPGDVLSAGPVAALAADGVAAEDRRLKAVDRVLDGQGLVAVAEQALGTDRPF